MKKSGKSHNPSTSHTVRTPFKFLVLTSLVSGVSSVLLSPSQFPRMLEIADAYDLFRVTKLKYRLGPSAATALSTQCAAYYPGVTDNGPATAADISENVLSTVFFRGQSVPASWVHVPRSVLAGYLVWYKTILGSPDPEVEIPGRIYVAGQTTDTYALEIEGEFEFKGPANTGATPAERGRQLRLKEKARLVMLLQEPDPPTSTASIVSGALAQRKT